MYKIINHENLSSLCFEYFTKFYTLAKFFFKFGIDLDFNAIKLSYSPFYNYVFGAI